jgi:hypothetical protein
MKMRMGDVITYKDTEVSARYGTGVVAAITNDEYSILWSGRGLTKYRRSILDDRLEQTFERADKESGLPKERHLHLGTSKVGVAFNENYDRARIKLLCEQLKASGASQAQVVAEGLSAELFTKKLVLRGAAKTVLLQLAELCSPRNAASDDAQNISKELFFGYVLQKSDFAAKK